MSDEINLYGFDPELYVTQMITDLGCDHENAEMKERLRAGIMKQMAEVILNTLSLNLEPDAIDQTLIDCTNEPDPMRVITQLVENSPTSQGAITEALEDFYEQMMDVKDRLAVH